jgi:hypothetical protein
MTQQTVEIVRSWPTTRLPVPAVERYPVTLVGESAIEIDWRFDDARGGGPWPVDLAPGFYLTGLCRLELEDAREIARFVALYGWFCEPGWKSLPPVFTRRDFHSTELHPRLAAIDQQIGDWITTRRTWRHRKHESWDDMTPEHRQFLHVDEVRVHAEFLRNAARLWHALSGGRTLESALAEWEGDLGLPAMLDEPAALRGTQERAAWIYLHETLQSALVKFHPRLELDDPVTRGAPQPTTYEALMLQLFNTVTTKTRYRRCASDTCGGLFEHTPRTRQDREIRAYIGTKYCSPECAHRQAVRNSAGKRLRGTAPG